jgi:hypothetical protein
MELIKKPPSMERQEPTMPRCARLFFDRYATNLLYGYFATNPKADRKSISSLTDLPEDKSDVLNWTLENSTEHQKAILHDEWTRTKANDSSTRSKRRAEFCFPNIQLKTFTCNSWSLLPEPALKVFRYISYADCVWLDEQRLAADALDALKIAGDPPLGDPPLGPPQSVYLNQWTLTRRDNARDPLLGPPTSVYVNQWTPRDDVQSPLINFPVRGLLKRWS